MFADSVSSMWPPAAPQAVAYAQVGDFLQMWLHRERVDAEFGTCDSCQTLNHRGALRCSTCGGRLMSNEDDAAEAARPKARGVARGVDVRALRRALTLVVLPSLLMFVGFGVWHEVRSGPRLTPLPPAVAQAPVHQVETPPLHLVAAEKHEAVQPRVQPQLAATPIDQAIENELDELEGLTSRPPASSSSRSAPSRAKALASAPARSEPSLRTACGSGNFLARAVCVNNLCATRGASRQPQCHEAVRQRRIDEARRNPTLMG